MAEASQADTTADTTFIRREGAAHPEGERRFPCRRSTWCCQRYHVGVYLDQRPLMNSYGCGKRGRPGMAGFLWCASVAGETVHSKRNKSVFYGCFRFHRENIRRRQTGQYRLIVSYCGRCYRCKQLLTEGPRGQGSVHPMRTWVK